MREWNDAKLLSAYLNQHSEAAFGLLVERYLALVYSAAQRQVQNSHLAEEVTQAVFIILAQKARALNRRTVLAGWLCRTAHFVARNALKAEFRRQQRELEAHMQSLGNEPDAAVWTQLAPLLDEAVAQLNDIDRNAIVLRFYERRPLHEVGNILGIDGDTAQKRVARAVDKLRRMLVKRGVAFSALAIIGALSVNSVQAAPLGLSVTVTTAAAKGATVSGSTLTLIQGTLKIMAWTKMKTAVVTGVAVLLAAGITTVSVKKYEAHQVALNSWRLKDLYFHPEALSNALPQVRIVPTKFKAPVYGGSYVPPNKFAMVRAPIVDIVAVAYGCSRGRIFFADGEPKERYDFVATLPRNNGKGLQLEIKKSLGLVVHKETRDTDVWALKVRNPNHSGIKPYDQGIAKAFYDIRGHIICTGQPLASLADRMEIFLRMPVIDETGLAGNYNLDLKWNEDSRQNTDHDLLKQALIDQLGLELVPTNMPVEMFIVDKAK